MYTMAPEAFTNTELAAAMNWRERQPEHIKQVTGSPESLMSLYKQFLRSKSHSHSSSRSATDFAVSLNGFSSGHSEPASHQAAPHSSVQETTLTAAQKHPPHEETNTAASGPLSDLDGKSLEMIQEIKHHLNLSTDLEALRALLKVGYDRLSPSLK